MPFITGLEKMAIREGLKKGRKLGFEKGERAGLLESLEVVLQIKYGKAAKKFFAELKAIRATAQLHAVVQAIRNDATIAELRKLL